MPEPTVHKGAKLIFNRTEVEVMHVSNGVACVIDEDGKMSLVHDPHQLTTVDHNEKVNGIVDVLTNSYDGRKKPIALFTHQATVLVKAGYRKLPALNREFSKGDTYNTEVDRWTSGINIPGHGNAIECYAGTKEGAELLRDEILERLL